MPDIYATQGYRSTRKRRALRDDGEAHRRTPIASSAMQWQMFQRRPEDCNAAGPGADARCKVWVYLKERYNPGQPLQNVHFSALSVTICSARIAGIAVAFIRNSERNRHCAIAEHLFKLIALALQLLTQLEVDNLRFISPMSARHLPNGRYPMDWNGTNAPAIERFLSAHGTTSAPIGAAIVLPASGQRFKVAGFKYWHLPDAEPVATGFVWSSYCAECGEPFQADTSFAFQYIQRRCAAHRQVARIPTPAPEDRRATKRRGKLENHVLATIANVIVAYDSMTIPDLVSAAVGGMPPPEDGKRDTRRQRILVALKSLAAEKTDAPIRIVGQRVLFETA